MKNKQHKQGYKQTPIGKIPNDWDIKKIGDIGEFKNGINKEKEEFGSGFPFINLMDIFGIFRVYNNSKFSLVQANERELNDFSLKKGDVLFVRSSVKPEGVGLTSLICEDIPNTTYSGFLIRFRDNHFFDFDYKAHCFHDEIFRRNLLNKSTISANTNINQEALKSLYIQIPPLPEQRKIATILSTWDTAIEKTTRIIENLKKRNTGLTQQLLSGKKRLKGFEKKEWKKLKANEIFKNYTKKNFPDEELLSVTQDRGVIPRDMLVGRVTMPDGDRSSFKLVEKGDFVISLRSFQGGLEYSEYRGIVSPAYTVLKECKPIANEFYKYYFKSYEFIGHLAVAVIGIRDGKQISYDDFCILRIPYPTIEEQNAITEVLNKAAKELTLYENRLEKLKLQKKGLMQKLLTGEVRVKF